MPQESYESILWTEDQRRWFNYLRNFHLALWVSFEDYFAGIGARRDFWEAYGIDIDHLGAYRSYYLALYALCQWEWQRLKDALPEALQGCQEPGDVLIYLLNENADHALSPLLVTYFEFTPDRQRTLARLETKAKQGKATPADQKRIANIQRQLDRMTPWRRGQTEASLLASCEQLAKDKTARRLLKALRVAEGDLERETAKGLHPRKCSKAYQIRDGALNIS